MSRDETTPGVAEQEEITSTVPLTPVQRWFFSRVDGASASHFNLSLLLEIPRLDPAPLAAALTLLARHHDALRLRFRHQPEGWEQRAQAPSAAPPGLLALDLSALPEERMSGAVTAVAIEVQESLDVTRGPLQRAVLFDLGTRRSGRLLWAVHHLVLDAVSWLVLLTDLAAAYGCLARGAPAKLPPKTTSFKRWAELLRKHATSPALAAELPFWRDLPWGTVTPLPRDIPSGENRENLQSSERSVTLELDQEETRALLSEVPRAYQTKIREVLLAAVARAFAAWTAAPVLLVNVEGHGRVDLFAGVDISRSVGWFTSFTPVVLDLGSVADPGSALKSVKEQLRRVPASGGVGFDLLGDLLPSLPTPEVGFNYVGQLDAAEAGSGGFRLAPEGSGPQRSPRLLRFHLIELESAVKGGRLILSCLYSENAHLKSTAERLLGSVVQELRELIAHCLRPGAGG
jgi:non-ribosomal peptide synthase protein (TIGR01720 family)